MTEENKAAVEALRNFCSALIEELAALGGEEKLFSHMKGVVETVAAKGDLQSLEETWKELKVWTRSLTEQQQAHVVRQMRQKFGMPIARDQVAGSRDLLIPDPGENLENESR